MTDKKDERWNTLGIEAIYYSKDEHDVMSESINQLGIRVSRGALDWKNNLNLMANEPPVDLTLQSEVIFCLQDETRTKILMNCIHGEKWLDWLDGRNVFNNLFLDDIRLTEIDEKWANWILGEFLQNNHIVISKLICNNSNKMNKEFVDLIAKQLVLGDKEYSDNTLADMVLLVKSYINDSFLLERIFDLLVDRNIIQIGWLVFKCFYKYSIIMKEELISLSQKEFRVCCKISSNAYYVNRAWKKAKDNGIMFNPVETLEFGKNLIVSIHNVYEDVGKATKEHEPYDLESIEVEEDDKYNRNNPIHTLFNIMFETASLIDTMQNDYLKQYIYQCLSSNSMLLRKFGLRLLRENNSISCHKKLTMFLSNISIHSIGEKEQIFKLIANIYDNLSLSDQKLVLSKIRKTNFEFDKRTIAYEKYNWGVWLMRNCHPDSKINNLIDEIKKVYPYFKQRKHPELNIYIEKATWTKDISPIEPEKMLIMKTEELFNKIDEYSVDEWGKPSRNGLLIAFSNTIKDNYEWTYKIIPLVAGNTKDDVWDYFYRGLLNSNYKTKEYINLLEALIKEDVDLKYTSDICFILKKCLELNETRIKFNKYKNKLHIIANELWKCQPNSDEFPEVRLIEKCYNCVTGVIISCWISMLSYEEVEIIPEEYKKIFVNALEERNYDRDQSICILVGQLSFLYTKDKNWCKDVIIPYLTSNNSLEFESAWEGIAWFSRRLYLDLADEMADIYLIAVKRLKELKNEAKQGFIELYLLLMIYAVENPIDRYIPEFFLVAEDKDKIIFAETINNNLENMDVKQKERLWNNWLRQYWINRVNCIPKTLKSLEGNSMLEWLTKLDFAYKEAVEIIINGTNIDKTDSIFWYDLGEQKWISMYPDETINLIRYVLDKKAYEQYCIHDIANLLKKLQAKCHESKTKKEEILIELGYFSN